MSGIEGVAVHRAPIAELLGVYNYSANLDAERPNVETGRWHPEPVAAALVAVAEAAQEWASDDTSEYYEKLIAMRRVVAALSEALASS